MENPTQKSRLLVTVESKPVPTAGEVTGTTIPVSVTVGLAPAPIVRLRADVKPSPMNFALVPVPIESRRIVASNLYGVKVLAVVVIWIAPDDQTAILPIII